MRQVRRSVFETNSSSTHSICITKNDLLNDKADTVYFGFGEFGWERNKLITSKEKASYLYTAIYTVCRDDEDRIWWSLDKIKETLTKHNVDFEFEEKSNSDWWENGYIDHGNELNDFVNDLVGDSNKLLKYLFSDESFILTGNDNGDYDVDINVNYEYEEYYKGN